jgi:hypothetical protein
VLKIKDAEDGFGIICFSERILLITEKLSPWETVIKREMLFIESRESANDPAVDQSAQDGSPLHAFKAP